MTERRPHWDDDLIEAVRFNYNTQMHYADEQEQLESICDVIAAVEDWHEKFVMHGAFRVLAERAASAEADRDRLANQLLNEVPDSYIQMKARALTAEAAIARVRERAGGPTPAVYGDWMAGYAAAMRDILRAMEGDSDD